MNHFVTDNTLATVRNKLTLNSWLLQSFISSFPPKKNKVYVCPYLPNKRQPRITLQSSPQGRKRHGLHHANHKALQCQAAPGEGEEDEEEEDKEGEERETERRSQRAEVD